MCFSIEVTKDIKSHLTRFRVTESEEDRVFYEALKRKAEDPDFVKEVLALKRRPTTTFFKEPLSDGRIYPGYFMSIMVQENNRYLLKKMRYRLRPKGSLEEIPIKFNVFNARVDSLEKRQTWKKIFTKQHGLCLFNRFYEWVEWEGKKRLISFAPQDRSLMWAPCLWDYWEDNSKRFGFYSFAIITDDPPQEVERMGHDRCPIFLKEEFIPEWLSPGQKSLAYFEILKKKELTFFENAWAA
jgi:putative SOS response-associated peptidase YedK